MSDLDALLAEVEGLRRSRRDAAEAQARQAADALDKIAHPNETDEQRQARREAEAERLRLAKLGVKFHD